MLATFMVATNVQNVYATDNEDYKAAVNDYVYYDTKDYSACDASTGPTSLLGNTNLEKLYNFFISKGLTPVQAAGALGNIDQESGGDPTIIQGGGHTNDPTPFGTVPGVGKGWGIIQWTGGGRSIVYAAQAKITTPIYQLETQANLVWWHMGNASPTGYTNMLTKYKTITDLRAAVTYYHTTMEGSADRTMATRYSKAQNLLTKYNGSTPTSTSDGVSADTCTGSVSGDAVKTAINYAWPTYHAPPYTTKKPSYATAISAAIKAGKYVGGGQFPGVDCGGFVTRVMQDSVDPEYNDTAQYKGPVGDQYGYLKNSGKYTLFVPDSTADMRPGDIAIAKSMAHTYMYVGKVAGFETLIASASYSTTGRGWRAPMAGHELPADPDYYWFRLK